MIGKLHSIFSEAGRGGDDSTIPGYGNPVTSRVVKDYLAAMRVEQLEARSGCAISLAMSGTDLQTITATSVGNHGYSMSPPSDGASSKV